MDLETGDIHTEFEEPDYGFGDDMTELDSRHSDDYQISPDYFFNWRDNASMMDYFSQTEDTANEGGKSQM